MLLRILRALSLVLLPALPAAAQLNDTFTDGNFTANPAWTGDVALFQVTGQQLQTNGPAVTPSQIQLVTPVQAVTGTTWEFWANLRVASSSGNMADVWLVSEQTDLKATGNRGYFVRLGGTPREVALFRKDATGSPAYVVDGADGTTTAANITVRVRVTRSTAGLWTLERDLAGGTSYTSEGSGTDRTYNRSQCVGVLVTHSSTNARNYYFDDFVVSDQVEPQLASATPLTGTTLDVLFNEPVAASTPASAFRLSGGAAATSAVRDAQDPGLVHLTFGSSFALGQSLTVEARNIVDLYGNVALGPLTATFVYNGTPIQPGPNQLLITEILADETPPVGLPAAEFIEIHNPSATNPLDLGGVRLLKAGSSTAAVFGAGTLLLPGEYAVVCASARVAQFASYGKVFGLSNFPSLTNTGDQLLLYSRTGRQLFEVSYADTWYRDNSKKDGGWTLEMVDTGNPCGGADNWLASTDASGGTPGRANAVRAANPDRTPPALLRAVASSPTLLRLTFGEKLDSALTANPALYSLGSGPAVQRVTPLIYDFRSVELTLASPLTPNQPYTLTVARATDCVGNAAGPLTSATLVLPAAAAVNDVVINEVLFNPRPDGVDFVELLNRSAKYIDLQGWQIGRVRPDSIAESRVIITEPYVLAPGQLAVLTSRPDIVQAQYASSHDPAAFLPALTLPTYSDDAGSVTLFNAQGTRIDRFDYNESMHLALLDTRDGVSLERLRADGPSRGSNFHSAAGSVGYATPGRRNSQALAESVSSQQFALEPEVFTPDDDGQQDYTTLSYRLDGAGYAASVTVYDAVGRLTRRLVRNESLATTGFIQWDGLTDSRHKAPVGYYVLHIELYQPGGGAKKEYKKTVVVGTRF